MTRIGGSRGRPWLDGEGPIVVGVDPSGRSTSAVLWAAEEAERTGSTLHLVAAYPSESARSDDGLAPSDLAGVARRLTLADMKCETRFGPPVSVLLDAAAGGSHARRGAGAEVESRRGLAASRWPSQGAAPYRSL